MLGKLLSLVSIGEAVAGVGMTRKLISDIVGVVALAIVGSIVAGGLVIGCLLELHAVLQSHGFDNNTAALITVVLALVLLGFIVFGIKYRIEQMRGFPGRVSDAESVVTSTVQSLIRGFYNGLTAPVTTTKR